MADISASLVKDLRERTGAGMMDCKKALLATGGDFEAAVDWLRAKGLAAAAKKASRTAAEGLVGVATGGRRGALVEVNSETDFVSRNDQFQHFVREAARAALDGAVRLDALLARAWPEGGTFQERLTHNVATIGEQQTVRRLDVLDVAEGVVASYVHNAVQPDMGRIGVLVALEGAGERSALEAFGRQLAMHVAAMNPLAVSEKDVDPALLERERAIAAEKAEGSGKPADIVARMVDGAVAKFAREQALLSQTFVIDGKTRVADAVEQQAKALGAPVRVAGFLRFQLGEGIERQDSDFAAEVAAAAGQR